MNENTLPALRSWLAGAPALADVEQLWVDHTSGSAPPGGEAGLYPRGVQVVARHANLLGDTALRCRARFDVRMVLPAIPGDDALATQNAQRLLGLRRWVAAQSAAHTAPTFGDDPATETLQAAGARLESNDREGSATYTVTLTAEFDEKHPG